MENFVPTHISNEKDLEYFEAFLNDAKIKSHKKSTEISVPYTNKKTSQNKPKKNDGLCVFLENHIGKPVKIEFLIGNKLEIKIGTLLNVYKDFIVLKPLKNGTTIICDIKSIKFITVVHDNNTSHFFSR